MPPRLSPEPPLPPGAPGAVAVELVRASFTIAGDVAAFDAARFRTKLAAHLPGVNEADVYLAVSAASVRVQATVVTNDRPHRTETAARLASFSRDPHSASEALDVTVEAALPPVVSREMMVVQPSTGGIGEDDEDGRRPAASGWAGLTRGAQIGIIVAAATAVVLLLVGLLVWWHCRRRRRRKQSTAATKEEGGIVFRGSTVPPPPPGMISSSVPNTIAHAHAGVGRVDKI